MAESRIWAVIEEAVTQAEKAAEIRGYDRAVHLMEATGNTTAARILREQQNGRIV